MAIDDITLTVQLAPCGEVLAGEHCPCGRTAAEVAQEVADYELWIANFRSQTSPEAAR